MKPFRRFSSSTSSDTYIDIPRVSVVPVLDDNFAYLLGRGSTEKRSSFVAIDPADDQLVLAALERIGGPDSTLAAVLNTHWHADHVGK